MTGNPEIYKLETKLGKYIISLDGYACSICHQNEDGSKGGEMMLIHSRQSSTIFKGMTPLTIVDAVRSLEAESLSEDAQTLYFKGMSLGDAQLLTKYGMPKDWYINVTEKNTPLIKQFINVRFKTIDATDFTLGVCYGFLNDKLIATSKEEVFSKLNKITDDMLVLITENLEYENKNSN